MMRRSDGNWEVTHSEIKRLLVLWPLIGVLFSAGAAWAGVHYGLEGKVDKGEFAVHVQMTAIALNRLAWNDSLQTAKADAIGQRIAEVVCGRMKDPVGCR